MRTDFHFHEWAFLAKTDMQAFERRRSQLLDEFMLESGPRRPQLEDLQRKIDRQRNTAATPEEAVVLLSSLMCESFCRLVGEIDGFRADLKRLQTLQSSMMRIGAADMTTHYAGSAAVDSLLGEELARSHIH